VTERRKYNKEGLGGLMVIKEEGKREGCKGLYTENKSKLNNLPWKRVLGTVEGNWCYRMLREREKKGIATGVRL